MDRRGTTGSSSRKGVTHMNQDGQDEGLVLVAFTLVPGANGPSFYAAVQNVFSTPICEAGMMLNFFDQNDQLVGTSASVLQSGRLYQLSDGTRHPLRRSGPDRHDRGNRP